MTAKTLKVQVHRPAHCALAFAIPWSLDDMRRQLARGPAADFAQKILRDRPGIATEAVWNTVVRRCVNVAGDVAAEVSAMGVQVTRRTTLGTLRDLCRRFRVITLIAHWRAASVHEGQILDIEGLLNALRRTEGPLTDRIQERLSTAQNNGQGSGAPASAELVARIINGALNGGDDDNGSGRAERAYRRREELDAVAGPSLVPGNRLELSDGLHSVDAVVSAIPPSFDGTLDLTVCNSMHLGLDIKRARAGCIVVVNEHPTSIEVRLAAYADAVRLLANDHLDYSHAMARVRATALARSART